MPKTKKSKFVSGAVVDIRPEEEKAKDFQFSEIVASANPVNWIEKNPADYRRFPIFNQDGSGSCVAQTQAKELGILRWLKDKIYVHFSAGDIYQRRSNKPASGMGSIDVRQIAAKGATLEVLAPSQNMSDAQMDALVVEDYKRSVGSVFAVPNYVSLTSGDMETIASVIQTTGKGVMVWFFWKIDEWTEHPKVLYPTLSLNDNDPSIGRHSVCAVDFTLVDGKKCLVIEDSWGSSYGLAGQRIIDEDFFKTRNFYAGYLVSFKFDAPDTKPHFVFNTDMEFGQTNDDIIHLQDCLKYEKLFPSNTQSSGYYGAITKKAVGDFQVKYGIVGIGGAGYGRAGSLTRAKLNEIYGQ